MEGERWRRRRTGRARGRRGEDHGPLGRIKGIRFVWGSLGIDGEKEDEDVGAPHLIWSIRLQIVGRTLYDWIIRPGYMVGVVLPLLLLFPLDLPAISFKAFASGCEIAQLLPCDIEGCRQSVCLS